VEDVLEREIYRGRWGKTGHTYLEIEEFFLPHRPILPHLPLVENQMFNK